MNTPYILFLITVSALPILALILSKFINIPTVRKLARPVIWFFVMHNLLFLMGYSVKGELFDFYIFSAEYFVFCFTVFFLFDILKVRLFTRIFRAVGLIVILLGIVSGFSGFLFFFMVISPYNEADKVFHFPYDGKSYETRRFSFGFVTLEDTRYTFETYREYQYLPIEKKIDKTDFLSLKTNVNIGEDGLKINIIKTGNKEYLLFQSKNGHAFLKRLD
jgi:hypothetical protein